MRINKGLKNVNASSDTEELNDKVIEDAINYVQSAIDRCGAYVRRNGERKNIAKECIANLAVVVTDLQSIKK